MVFSNRLFINCCRQYYDCVVYFPPPPPPPSPRPNFDLVEQGLNRLLAMAMSAEPDFVSLEENFYQLLKSERFQVVGL